MKNTEEKKWPPFPNIFFEEYQMYTPRDMQKYGYRLKPGMTYRLYSGAEIKDRIKDGTIVPPKTRSSKEKKVVEKESAPPAIPAPAVKPPPTKEERVVLEAQFLERMDRLAGPHRIKDALERWHLKKGNKGELTDSEKASVQRLLEKHLVMIKWDDKLGGPKVVVLDKNDKDPG